MSANAKASSGQGALKKVSSFLRCCLVAFSRCMSDASQRPSRAQLSSSRSTAPYQSHISKSTGNVARRVQSTGNMNTAYLDEKSDINELEDEISSDDNDAYPPAKISKRAQRRGSTGTPGRCDSQVLMS